MGGNRYPNVPKGIMENYRNMSKADLIETLYDVSEINAPDNSLDSRSTWVVTQIDCRQRANKKRSI